MNKTKKKFHCPYCAKEFLRGSRGYGNHFRAAHPAEYSRGLRLYGSSLGSATWDKIDLAAEAAYRDKIDPKKLLPKLRVLTPNSDLEYLVQIGNEVNGCWSVTFNPTSDPDPVNHPPHYGGADDPYEAIKVIHAWNLGFDLGNVLKYIRRADCKGTPIKDLERAKFYLEDEIRRRKEAAVTTDATPNTQT